MDTCKLVPDFVRYEEANSLMDQVIISLASIDLLPPWCMNAKGHMNDNTQYFSLGREDSGNGAKCSEGWNILSILLLYTLIRKTSPNF